MKARGRRREGREGAGRAVAAAKERRMAAGARRRLAHRRSGRARAQPAQRATPLDERLLRQLEWRVVRRLDGMLQGDYRSLFRGAGIDFTDLREYEPGDDLRHIEWNVTARLDTPYVREYVEDREVTAWLLLDHSASMDFGPIGRQKDLVLAETANGQTLSTKALLFVR